MIKNQNAIQGRKCFQEKRFAQAAIYFQKWIDEEPEYFKAYISKGIALHYNNQFEDALLEYCKAQEKAPGNQKILESRAAAKRNLGKDSEVIEELEKLITQGKKCSTIFYCLGRSYYNLRQYSKAKQNYLKAIQQNGEYYPAYMELGIIYKEQWKQRESIEYLSKAIYFSKDKDESAYLERAMTYQQVNDRWNCLQDINKAIQINPNSCMAFHKRAIFCLNSGIKHEHEKMDINYANKTFDKYEKDSDPMIMTMLKNWKIELKEFIEKFEMEKGNKCLQLAIEDFKQVMKMDESRTQDSLYSIAEAELYLNYEDRALKTLNSLLQIDSKQSRAHELKFEVRLAFGRFEEAIQEYTEAICKGYVNQIQHPLIMLPYFKMGNFEEIIKMSSKASTFGLMIEEFYLYRGFSYLKTREYVKAEEDFQSVLKYYPEQHMEKFQLAHFGIGMAAKKRGLIQKAEKEIAYVEKISEGFPLFYFGFANLFIKDWEKAKKAFDSGIALWKCYEELVERNKSAVYKYQTNSEIQCMNKAIVEYLQLENKTQKFEERIKAMKCLSLLSSIEKLKKFLIIRVLFIIFQQQGFEEIEKEIGEEVQNVLSKFSQAFIEEQYIETEKKKKVSSSEQLKIIFSFKSDVAVFKIQMFEKMTLKTESYFHLIEIINCSRKNSEQDLTNKISYFLNSKVQGESFE